MRVTRARALFATLLGLSGLIAPSFVRAETYPDCEKFDDPFAYNRCLASHGPVAGQAHTVAMPPDGVPGIHGGPSPEAIHRTRNGRMSMTIDVEPEQHLPRPEKAPRRIWRRH